MARTRIMDDLNKCWRKTCRKMTRENTFDLFSDAGVKLLFRQGFR